jgi:predicted Zn-dependent protease
MSLAMTEPDSDLRMREAFDEALRLRDAGQVNEALSILRRLADQRPDLANVVGMLAGLEYQTGDYESAARNARNAVKLAPRSELASVILFHSLYRLQSVDEAFAEVERFRTIKSSDEYEKILTEMDDDTSKALQQRPFDAVLQLVLRKVRAEIALRPIKN